MNVLLTCAGRRNYLVTLFREALQGRGHVFASDAWRHAPALQGADKGFLVPRVDQPDYIDTLLALCRQHEIRLLIPLIDLELPLLAEHRDRFLEAGTVPAVSSRAIIDTCSDKWQTFTFLKRRGFDTPSTHLSLADAHVAIAQGELVFPVMIKPRWGAASSGLQYVVDEDELRLAFELASRRAAQRGTGSGDATATESRLLIQQRLVGQEYGLDIVNDLDGHHVCTFVRQKLLMRAGETDSAVTVCDDRFSVLGKKIGETLAHIGNLDCDVLVTQEGLFIIDMNPRFGGGYPFSHLAGARLPAALIAWANGEEPDPQWFHVEPDIVGSKYDTLVQVEQCT